MGVVHRRWLVVTVLSVLAAACGSAPQAGRATVSAPSASPGGAEEAALDVFVVDATIDGELDRVLDVEAHPPGTLVPGETLQPLVTFTTTSQEVSIADGPYFAGAFAAEEGDGLLGVSGVCGRGWRQDGSRVLDDPCSAATPLTSIQAGFPTTMSFALSPRVDGSRATAGRYRIAIPLGPAEGAIPGSLHLVYELAPRDPARLPAWPEATVPFRISIEEAPSIYFADDPPPLTIRLEDPYRRLLVERSLSEILAEGNEAPSFEVLAPPGPWSVVTLVAGPGSGEAGLVRCGQQNELLHADKPAVLTLVLDHLAIAGRCPFDSG